jgi:hypothetical protein
MIPALVELVSSEAPFISCYALDCLHYIASSEEKKEYIQPYEEILLDKICQVFKKGWITSKYSACQSIFAIFNSSEDTVIKAIEQNQTQGFITGMMNVITLPLEVTKESFSIQIHRFLIADFEV